jgi:protein-serine/threonine kinase
LHYLHEELQLANRDIKPDNILFTTRTGGSNPDHPDRAQITDFTTVVKCKGSNYKVNDDAGTLAFKPPECIWSGAPYCPKAFDVWSLGVSIYCLMFEQLPFNRENLQHEIKNS